MTNLAFRFFLFIAAIIKPVLAASQFDATTEITRRSGLPQQEVKRLTRDCSANQQSMYFCAWRDLVIAENKLNQRAALTSKSRVCADEISMQLATWFKKRDAICRRDAAQAVGGGSDEPRQRVACKASMTENYTQHFDELTTCK